MNLIADIGNTTTKLALTKGGTLIRKERLASADPQLIDRFIGNHSLDGAIVSSVSINPAPLTEYLRTKCDRVHCLTWRSVYPFKIDYDTPETLGVDRLAAATGAVMHHPGADLLVIDAGSALTADLVSGEVYRGGIISPGLSMRFRALHEYTGRLPLVAGRNDVAFPGRTTEEAIASGVVMGLVFEINEYIRTFEEKHKKPVTVITGGDSELISSRTDRKLFIYPDLVTEGLSFLLDTNV